MKTHIFNLRVVPVEDIIIHEEFDPKRTKPLSEKIIRDGIFTNPIIVSPFSSGKYLQLDGMNRLSVFKLLKYPNILAQIIDYNDQESIELSSWIHLFPSRKEDIRKHIEEISECSIKEGRIDQIGHRYVKEEGQGRLCSLVFKNGEVWHIASNGKLKDKVEYIRRIVEFYKNKIIRDVLPVDTHSGDVETLFKSHTDTNTIMVFPTFTRHQIIDVVKKGGVYPPGITRHIIKRRCLNLNLPLQFFRQRKSVEELNHELENNLLKRAFRVYEEPTIFFE